MLCQKCHKRIANVHFTQIINNSKTEMYLCEQCAREQGQASFISPLNINSLLSGFAGSAAAPFISPAPKNAVCDKCAMSFEEFQQVGKLGCNNCYEVFGERLKSILKRLHGNVEHCGKTPGRVSNSIKTTREIERLKNELNKAVQNEEYEKAAELRDRIKSMENGMHI